MDFKEYQQKAMRTKGNLDTKPIEESLIIGGLGISGEAGEVTDYIKKIAFHGHTLDSLKLAKEIGDVMWYMALLAYTIGIDLEQIAEMNIEKLKVRYPNGFESEKSINRKE
jgi:NTP pyrophosphatase (non-canonical NTP hydrolase)